MIRRSLAALALAAALGGLAMAQDAPPRRKVLEVPFQNDLSTILETFRPALKAAGKEWTTARLMGTFGHAFTFSMDKTTGEMWQTANIDWGQFFDGLGSLGRETEVLQGALKGSKPSTPEQVRELKEKAWKSVRASLDRGVPAIAWSPMTLEQKGAGACVFEWALLTGYDEAKKTYTVRHRRTEKTSEVPYDGFGQVDGVKWFCVIVLGAEKKVEPKTATLAALENALALGKGSKKGGSRPSCDGADAGGVPALELWLDAFRSGKVSRDHAPGHAEFLRRARTNAAAYLREVAGDLGEKHRPALLEAADLYAKVAEAAETLAAACREDKAKSDAAKAIASLTAALENERKAVARLEQVVAAAR